MKNTVVGVNHDMTNSFLKILQLAADLIPNDQFYKAEMSDIACLTDAAKNCQRRRSKKRRSSVSANHT